jgi:multicomponent Na+:H+ antiporter subunit D
MVVGVLGAIAQDDIRRILSFTIVSQIGYMVMGLGFFTLAAIAAVVYSIVHHIIVKTALFLIGGLIDNASGSSRLSRIGGMVRTTPFLAAMFLVSALSLVGIPPLSGFISKFALVHAGIASREFATVAVALMVSLLTLFSMVRIWGGAFWSPPEATAEMTPRSAPSSGGGPLLMVAPTALLVACSLVVAAAAGPLYSLSERTARDLLDRDRYIGQVLER